MMKIIMMLVTSSIISIGMMMMCAIIFKKSILDREKMSPFECGFDPKSSSRLPFSIQFFLIAMLFLIFDIEIVIVLPMIITMKMTNMAYWMLTSMMFMVVLLGGLYHEWNNGVLEWAV